MIDRTHVLPISRQAKVLNISRGAVCYQPRPVSPKVTCASCGGSTNCIWRPPFAGNSHAARGDREGIAVAAMSRP